MISTRARNGLQIPKIVWLSSYPKSGNTWFRSFLSALFYGEVDINNLLSDGHFSSLTFYTRINDIDCRMLTHQEMQLMIPESLRLYCKHISSMQFMKTHDAYQLNDKGEPIFDTEASHKVLHFVRNPLDVVASFANHLNQSLDKAIDLMNHPQGSLVPMVKNGHHFTHQMTQLMLDWSSHIASWLNQSELEVHLMRYEDSKVDTFKAFKTALEFLELSFSDEQIQAAIDLVAFEKLQRQEQERGFVERQDIDGTFFRKGKVGGWKEELSEKQVERIIDMHGDVMERFNYKPE